MAKNTSDLKKFAQAARRQLREQVAGRLEQVLRTDSAELRQKEAVVKELRQQIAQTSKNAVIDRVAYTWFNRFCALRFMDVNRYNRIGVVSPTEGFTQPEILQEAKQGYIDEELKQSVNKTAVFDLLSGKIPSADPQQEAYRLLLVAVCNFLNDVMPFMFEKITDYTELLMPLDLLSDNSILHALRAAMTAEACQDVEVIGWLYQYYISERKDEVFEALKQNKKIEAEDIPAATQLFTPHWIVRYLLENSLGRWWMLNKPHSRLVEKMEYYIKPIEEETDYLKIASPEEIRLCDPACGSGHMLTYAFDLLYAIYEEEGYNVNDIPRLILENNLYGIEIDERAGSLAAFALFMKARGKEARFFSHAVQPNICVLENITFTDQELNEYMNSVGRDLFSEPLRETLKQFEHAKNFGSLIRPILTDINYFHQMLETKNLGCDIFLFGVYERAQKTLRMAEYLLPRYHVVVANPPYMGNGGMNNELRAYANNAYPNSKADTYAMFIERSMSMVQNNGVIGMITLHNWMFIKSFEKFRYETTSIAHISTLIHNGRGVWGSDFGSCAFILIKNKEVSYKGIYRKLFKGQGEVNSNDELINNFFRSDQFKDHFTSIDELNIIPGLPIAYWASERFRNAYKTGKLVSGKLRTAIGLNTGDNQRFLRYWFEVSNHITFGCNSIEEMAKSDGKWFPYNKGGSFRKWFGNREYVIDWENDGDNVKIFSSNRNNGRHWSRYIQNLVWMGKQGITWTFISASKFGVRFQEKGFLFDVNGSCAFLKDKGISDDVIYTYLGLFCSHVSFEFLRILNPTLAFQASNIGNIPLISSPKQKITIDLVKNCIAISRKDWDAFETSWDFTELLLLTEDYHKSTLASTYRVIRAYWQEITLETKRLEEENNCLFIETYGVQEEMKPDVPLEEITLTCNPYYRYGGDKSEIELEALLLADTIKEFISYTVGCMFGRYSLDKPGLILANQGETLQDYLRQIPDPTLIPDEDNAIPILDGDWFSDDITERFKKFLRVTFGDEHYDENLAFIEEAIGRDIRSYFLKGFYAYHIKMYKKRPIYWLFSSPRGSFNVLIYMHRYNKDTLSVILNRYLREFRAKLEARKSYLEQISISASASPREKTAALREIEKLSLILEELRVYERDVLFPLAAQQIEIDLDDGVKVNYAKFGSALAVIK